MLVLRYMRSRERVLRLRTSLRPIAPRPSGSTSSSVVAHSGDDKPPAQTTGLTHRSSCSPEPARAGSRGARDGGAVGVVAAGQADHTC